MENLALVYKGNRTNDLKNKEEEAEEFIVKCLAFFLRTSFSQMVSDVKRFKDLTTTTLRVT